MIAALAIASTILTAAVAAVMLIRAATANLVLRRENTELEARLSRVGADADLSFAKAIRERDAWRRFAHDQQQALAKMNELFGSGRVPPCTSDASSRETK